MSQTPVTTDIHEALDVGHNFTTEVTLYLETGLNLLAQGIDVLGRKVVAVLRPVDTCRVKDFESCSSADPVNICQCNI
jgi:hypothetical protein